MKKTFATAILFLLGTALHAGPVTPERALRVAEHVFSSAPATKSVDASSLKIVWDGEFEPATKAAQDPALYVITRPEGGFVMVAGDDNVQPVLGFSFENDFKAEGMPAHVRWWMELYKDYVRSASTTTLEIVDQWARLEETKANAEAIEDGAEGLTDEFLDSRTNLWNQTNPANYFCPDLEGVDWTSLCGCQPLTMAEIMAWFGTGNPPYPTGTIPSYTYTNIDNGEPVTIPEHAFGTGPDWEGLKGLSTYADFLSQIEGYSEATEENYQSYLFCGASRNRQGSSRPNTLTPLGCDLASLVYDIATILQAEFYAGGTSVTFQEGPFKLAPVMGYNKNARYILWEGYSYGQWESMLTEQISRYPIPYSGSSGDGFGHSYVADGYANYCGKRLFHFNMGWGGVYNGYYTLNIQYRMNQRFYAIVNFYPAPESVALPILRYNLNGGLLYRRGYYTGHVDFSLKHMQNFGYTFEGVIFAGIENASGSLLERSVGGNLTITKWSGYPSISFYSVGRSNPEQAVLGDQVRVFYQDNAMDKPLPIEYRLLSDELEAIPFYPAAAIKKAESYHVGDCFKLTITNNAYLHHYSRWKVTAPDGTTSEYDFDDYDFPLTSAGEYKIEATIFYAEDPSVELETLVTYLTVD